MIIVVPMAGRGQRFVDAGFDVPKPLIEVHGRPMYTWAVESLPLALATRIVFVCLAEHLERAPLEADIAERYAALSPVVVPLDGVTDGQLCTVLEAADHIDAELPLLVYNADTWCRTGLERSLPALDPGIEGLVGVFEAEGDHWSFARLDDHGDVIETAEKQRISTWATTGLYWFRRGDTFLRHARAMVADDERTRGEFYVAPLYNRMIATGERVRVDVAQEVQVLGTPAELEAFVPPIRTGHGRRPKA